MTARLLQIVVGVAGLCALVLGLFIWIANSDLTDIHILFGLLVTLGLVVMSIIALTASGLRIWGIVGIVYALIVLIFGVSQASLLVGNLRLYDPGAAHAGRHRRDRADGLDRRTLQNALCAAKLRPPLNLRRCESRAESKPEKNSRERRKEMRVSREGNLITLINVFETRPEQQQELIAQWIRFAESVKEEPGLIGTALHRSTDGTRIVNYAQWRSEADYARFVQKYREQMEARRPAASRVDPHLYEVVYLFERRGS
jgi:heme-degrading monooxygenase HmoA